MSAMPLVLLLAASAWSASPAPALYRGIPIGTSAHSASGDLRLALTARIQNYRSRPDSSSDYYDEDVSSPKSVLLHPDGGKAYVNFLEGYSTAVYDARTLAKISVIRHRFGENEAGLFPVGPPFDYRFMSRRTGAGPNVFSGKPVEMALTHGGRYLWISYYRRDYDRYALGPSAVAVVDTRTDSIVRVLHSGPIPKYVVASPDGSTLAMIHWGDNTVGFADIRPEDPAGFSLSGFVEVGRRLDLERLSRSPKRANRDKSCGSCLRGAVFSPDGRWLLIAKLTGGGIAVVDALERRYVGTAVGMRPTPRHLVVRGDRLYVGSNVGGYVAWFRTEAVIEAARNRLRVSPGAEVHIGPGVRTIDVSPDGRWVYATVSGMSKLTALRAEDLSVAAEIRVDSYPVGLDVSPDGTRVWVTSQGRDRKGGNSVSIVSVDAR